MSLADRRLAQIIRRLDMMLCRGVLRGTVDAGAVQTMQCDLLEGEVADQVERFQTYGLSSSPPAGAELVVASLQGNRDHPVVLAVNHRGSRPRGLGDGEVVLYNDKDCTVTLSLDGDVVVKGARNVAVESVENVTVAAAQNVEIAAGPNVTIAGARIDLNGAVFINGVPFP